MAQPFIRKVLRRQHPQLMARLSGTLPLFARTTLRSTEANWMKAVRGEQPIFICEVQAGCCLIDATVFPALVLRPARYQCTLCGKFQLILSTLSFFSLPRRSCVGEYLYQAKIACSGRGKDAQRWQISG